ncbi:hypothetical protein HNR44_002336 [Geomicrobium halophilum]|uniref:PDZ domain-containing protein n=1 Tax=Geomicrobium halophilum TaxID=549000 RepID=A0A841PZH3_9BACL|nr:PDZ domain-containing protein [Geomicrobium halophilum]MBB6450353.1 hypothetical protein [Geomicrobium halophilum]
MQNWLIDIVVGIGIFFIHPLTYVGLLAMLWIGYRRVKRERKMFHTSLGSMGDDLFHRLLPGLLAGFIISIITVVTGVMLTPGYIIIAGVIYLLLILVGGARFASPAYALGVAYLLTYLLTEYVSAAGNTVADGWLLEQLSIAPLPVLILIAVFLVVEGVLVRSQGKRQQFSPIRLRSSRGKWLGGQRLDRLWLVPVCLFVPGETFATEGWWPLLSVTDEVSMLVLPFLIGVQQTVIGQLMVTKVKEAGTRLMRLGILVSVGVLVYVYQPWLAFPLLLAVILGRLCLQFYEYRSDRKKPVYFVPRTEGVVILGVMPGSPAEKMGLLPGEVITKVHQESVNDEWSFYHNLQINSAYAHVEVIDNEGEPRVERAAIYDNQHHELGLLFLHPNKEENVFARRTG